MFKVGGKRVSVHSDRAEAEQRRMLLRAKGLGFGRKCVQLLSLYRFMPLREAAAYLAEIEEEEAGQAEDHAKQQVP